MDLEETIYLEHLSLRSLRRDIRVANMEFRGKVDAYVNLRVIYMQML